MSTDRPYALAATLALFGAASGWAVWEWLRTGGVLAAHAGHFALLVLVSVLAEGLLRRLPASGPPRLSGAFVLSALVSLPSPGGLLVGLAVLACGARPTAPVSGVAVLAERFPSILALCVTQALASAAAPFFPPGSAGSFLLLGVLYIHLHGIALATEWLVGHLAGADPLGDAALPARRIAWEAVAVPLAWVLLALESPPSSPAAQPLFSALVLLGAVALRQLAIARRDLQETNDALAARATELAMLHSIGREIVSSLDLRRVFATIERECRKILEVDRFCIALVERDTQDLRVAYRHARGERPEENGPGLPEGLEAWVVAERQGVRINDPRSMAAAGVASGPDGAYRSALAVPLIVEDRVLGVLEVQSRREHAYSEHLLAVLGTVAQQAAVAIENARHHKMATVDSLTGLFLRDYFFRRVEEEHNRARRYQGVFALLMIDLDGLKSLNDRFGHLAGDRYLQSLGREVRTRLRAADLACRFGGDEFCLLLPETDARGAAVMAERLRGAVERLTLPIDGSSEPLRATASIGSSVFPDDDAGDLPGLLRRADQALYRAKRRGRNRVVGFSAAEPPRKPGTQAATGS